MEIEQLLKETNVIFWNRELNDDDVAERLLDLFDEHREIIQFDEAFTEAHRELNIWSRTEINTGEYLDVIQKILSLKEN